MLTFNVADVLADASFHKYVPPPVAVSAIEVVPQVSAVVVGVDIAAVGAVMSCVMVIDSVSVHPLAEVTVTV